MYSNNNNNNVWLANSSKLENIKKNSIQRHLHNLYFKEYAMQYARIISTIDIGIV